MIEPKIASLHMSATSRQEKDIEESLSLLLYDEQKIYIQSALGLRLISEPRFKAGSERIAD